MTRHIAAIVLCAGKGTRMKSARAKVLHEVLGRPISYYPISRAFEVGASPVVAVVGHQAEQVQSTLEDQFARRTLQFALQEKQLGTAHAVLAAKPNLEGFDGEIFILYGDTPMLTAATLKALRKAKRARKAPLALVGFRPPNPHGYGRLVREGKDVARIVEQKDCTPEQTKIGECNAGMYLVDAGFLWKALERIGKGNAQGEFYLTDLVAIAHESKLPVASIEAPFEEVSGVNDRVELARAGKAMRQRINERHMRNGVTFDDPDSTLVEESVKLAADVRIGPNCVLAGDTRIGKGTVIGPGCVLTNATVGENVTVRAYSVFEDAKVSRGGQIGPFARLRPGTELAEGVHIGNFVETKKARIGKGSKANHLAYLGDAVIGSGVNVGAGTITCNYDGVNKHQTVLGDGVFIGSDSQLVAPVTVGKGSYVGAGSTIVEDVPPNSLAIARSRQVTKKDYVKKKRAAG